MVPPDPREVTIREEALKTVRHSAIMVPFRAYAMGIQFVTALALARLLASEGFGQWGLMMAVAQWGYTFFISWTGAALTRYGREEFLATGRMNVSFTTRTLLVAPGILAMLLIAVLFSEPLAATMNAPRSVVALVACYTLSFALSETVQYILPAVGRSDLTSALLALERTLIFAGILYLHSAGSANTVTALAAFIAPGCCISLVALARFREIILPFAVDREHVARYWKFCKPVLVTAPMLGIVGWVDLFVIRHYITLAAVGNYFLAYQFYNAFTQLCIIVTTVFNPFTVLLVMRGRDDLTDLLVNRMQWVACLMASALCLLTTVVARIVFVRLGGPNAPLMNDVWLFLIPGGVATFMAAPIGPIYTAKEESVIPAFVCGAMMITNVGFDLLLVPRIGPRGAAIATSLGGMALYFFFSVMLRRFDIHSRRVVLRLLCGPAVAILVYGLDHALPILAIGLLFTMWSGWEIWRTLKRRDDILSAPALT